MKTSEKEFLPEALINDSDMLFADPAADLPDLAHSSRPQEQGQGRLQAPADEGQAPLLQPARSPR